MELPKIQTASVKVMRSHDYCHFEVCLGSSEANSPEAVDELRKTAARLADKAVEQYRIAKISAEKLLQEKSQRSYLIHEIHQIRKKEVGDRTVREQAQLKAFEDEQWQATRGYDYEDDWRQDGDEY